MRWGWGSTAAFWWRRTTVVRVSRKGGVASRRRKRAQISYNVVRYKMPFVIRYLQLSLWWCGRALPGWYTDYPNSRYEPCSRKWAINVRRNARGPRWSNLLRTYKTNLRAQTCKEQKFTISFPMQAGMFSYYIYQWTTGRPRRMTVSCWRQSSKSSLLQYIGLCPIVTIHGRFIRFSGLAASCQPKYCLFNKCTRLLPQRVRVKGLLLDFPFFCVLVFIDWVSLNHISLYNLSLMIFFSVYFLVRGRIVSCCV